MMSNDVFNCFSSLIVKTTSFLVLLLSIPILFLNTATYAISCLYWIFICGADPSRFRLTHETSFVRAHATFWTRIPVFFYIVRPNLLICYVFVFICLRLGIWFYQQVRGKSTHGSCWNHHKHVNFVKEEEVWIFHGTIYGISQKNWKVRLKNE